MNKPTIVRQDEGLNYQPKLFCVDMMPGLEPKFYEHIPESGVDAIIIGTTVPTGGVPNEGEFSFIPFIERATALKIPVYMVRGSLSAKRKLAEGCPPVRRDINVTNLYGPERDAIEAGAIPLESPDASQLEEVVEEIRRVYSRRPNYQEGIDEVSKLFSSPEFIEQIRKIRE